MRQRISEYFQKNQDAMIEDLSRLIRIDSVKSAPLSGMPFGEKCALVLAEVTETAKRLGFRVTNYDNYVVAIDMNDNPSKLDILAHMDVVPAVDQNWTVTEPFKPLLTDGKIYGRGAADDKGPAIAALYAMHAVVSLGIPISWNCRLILGADEESGASDIAYYYEKEPAAEMTFTPDSDFPLINSEKGGYWSAFTGSFEPEGHPRILELHGGEMGNAVPAHAWARLQNVSLEAVKRGCAKAQAETGISFTLEQKDGTIVVEAEGISAHASTPELGNNALTGLLQLLQAQVAMAENGAAALLNLAKLFPHGDWLGEHSGVSMEQPAGCKLTLGLNILNYDGRTIDGRIDTRLPACATDENVSYVLRSKFSRIGLTLHESHICPAHYVPEESYFVKELLECYEEYTGNRGYCISTGGMTYTHHVKNGVAFGCTFPGTNNHMHGADEFMSLHDLITSGKIFSQVIINLCK